jgi:2,3-bisphosphoglycerate-dependent phosphoglycerate mutase
MHTIVLLRHGESEWNKENIFTGWTDVDLDTHGREQARHAGELMRNAGIIPDVVFTSFLKRAIRTAWLVLDELDLMWVPLNKSWRLNERHYGALQGMNKSQTATEYGEEQVKIWRRAYAIQPPAVEEGDERNPINAPQYKDMDSCVLPRTESLQDTFNRIFPYWTDSIVPEIQQGKTVLVAAHGNTLRALVKYIDQLDDEAVMSLNIPIGEPLVYELGDDLQPIRHYYLNSEEEIAKGVQRQIDMGRAYLNEVG